MGTKVFWFPCLLDVQGRVSHQFPNLPSFLLFFLSTYRLDFGCEKPVPPCHPITRLLYDAWNPQMFLVLYLFGVDLCMKHLRACTYSINLPVHYLPSTGVILLPVSGHAVFPWVITLPFSIPMILSQQLNGVIDSNWRKLVQWGSCSVAPVTIYNSVALLAK